MFGLRSLSRAAPNDDAESTEAAVAPAYLRKRRLFIRDLPFNFIITASARGTVNNTTIRDSISMLLTINTAAEVPGGG